MKTNYKNAKLILLDGEKTMNFDPVLILDFLSESLKNNDIKFYKKRIPKIMRNYGWSFTSFDTIGNALLTTINEEIKTKNLTSWTIKKSNHHYSYWVKKNPDALRIKQKLIELHTADQTVRKLGNIKFIDSTFNMEYKKKRDSLIASIDLNNIRVIEELCIKNNGEMINNFQHGIHVYSRIDFIIYHNLKNGSNFDKCWEILFPYLEKSYLNGKIPNWFFNYYDFFCNYYKGYQFYGTLGEKVIVKDVETLNERKAKYKL